MWIRRADRESRVRVAPLVELTRRTSMGRHEPSRSAGPSTDEEPSRLPSGGMPDTDPLASSGMLGALPRPDDPEALRVRALLESRLLGEGETSARIGRFTVL